MAAIAMRLPIYTSLNTRLPARREPRADFRDASAV
jgi:hypothetical protein